MLDEGVRVKAIELAESIKSLGEYQEFLENEKLLKEDKIAQELLLEFQQKQQDFVTKQLSGEYDQDLLGELTDLQSRINARESVVRFIESYNRLLAVIGEIVDLISEKIELDIGEVYRR
uniref:YlbF family regulator n=1 Tax=Archaeoglobus fulgidus TaxID=2234 RepID=A0A7C3MBF9_ARCFL